MADTSEMPSESTRIALGDVSAFCRQVLDLGDLSPAATILVQNKPPGDPAYVDHIDRCRFLVAYSLFDHAGVAAAAASTRPNEFWPYLLGRMKDLPRGSRRKDFQGQQAFHALAWLEDANNGDCTKLLIRGKGIGSQERFSDLQFYFLGWPQFSLENAFWLTDLVERSIPGIVRVSGQHVQATALREAVLACRLIDPDTQPPRTLLRVLKDIGKRKAPPMYHRPLCRQDAVGLLGLYHVHLSGTYKPGDNARKLAGELKLWGHRAEALRKVLIQICPSARSFP